MTVPSQVLAPRCSPLGPPARYRPQSLSMQLRRRHYADTTGYTLDSMAPGAGNRLVGPLSQPRTFCGLINDALKLEKNVLVNCNGEAGIWNKKGHLKFENNSRMNIDVWIVGQWTPSLCFLSVLRT